MAEAMRERALEMWRELRTLLDPTIPLTDPRTTRRLELTLPFWNLRCEAQDAAAREGLCENTPEAKSAWFFQPVACPTCGWATA